uniref:Uncharacterized protein n=1 Tax=Heterorhabditis bacteriophora TaxID=37862 RepID=A0A1I7WWS0_HETBA
MSLREENIFDDDYIFSAFK